MIRHGVPAAGNAEPKPIAFCAAGGDELECLSPSVGAALVAGKDVGRTLIRVAAYVSEQRPDDGRVAADRHGEAKLVLLRAVGSGKLGGLAPGIRAALVTVEDVGRTLVGDTADVGPIAPATDVSPLTDTETPKPSPVAPSAAVSL
mgnify:CR=1 FL=1